MSLLQFLPKKHGLIALALLGLIVILLLGKWLVSGNEAETTATLGLPPMATVPISSSADAGKSHSNSTEHPPKLAEVRPVLAEPGLHFVDHSEDEKSAAPVSPAPQPSVEKKAQTSSVTRKQQADTPSSVSRNAPSATKSSTRKTSVNTSNQAAKPASSQPTTTNPSPLFVGLPDDAWLLQIGTASSLSQAKQQCGKLNVSCVSYAAHRNGRRVWVMVVGPYATHSGAENAVTRLPQALQKRGPFPRQIADVRADAAK